MSRVGRLRAETSAATRAFLRRRTAVFFTFVFPAILVLIFGVLVQARPGGGGLFTEPPRYYVAGYLATVVLFTPLSRVGSEVARHRDDNRFEKLATTPLTRAEWLLAQTAVNTAIIGAASVLLVAMTVALTGATVAIAPLDVPLLALFVALGVALFCGVGAVLGALTSSQDGVVAASNTVALPLLFLSETFVPPDPFLPAWLPTGLSPLTYFSRGVRSLVGPADPTAALPELVVVASLAVLVLAVGAYALPRTD